MSSGKIVLLRPGTPTYMKVRGQLMEFFLAYDVGHREGTQVSMLGRITFPLSHLISQSPQTQNLMIYVFVFIFWVIPQLWKLSPENISTQLRAINGVWEESMRRVADFKSLHGASVFFSNKSGWDGIIFPSLWPPSPMIKPNNSPCSLSYIPGL